jgi:hypothetical protein
LSDKDSAIWDSLKEFDMIFMGFLFWRHLILTRFFHAFFSSFLTNIYYHNTKRNILSFPQTNLIYFWIIGPKSYIYSFLEDLSFDKFIII